MSGGSWNYVYRLVQDAAANMADDRSDHHGTGTLRRAFAKHLTLVAEALHDIEWVDSFDDSPGDEVKAIRAALGPAADALVLAQAVQDAERVLAALQTALAAAKVTTP